MSNFSDYIVWRGDISFKTCPFNEVDALILCQLSYINVESLVPTSFSRKSITLRELGWRFANAKDYIERSNLGAMINPLTIDLLKSTAESVRFGSLRLCGYQNIIDVKKDEQFSAITFCTEDGTNFIAYRGTDDSIVGWKEDFDLGWKEVVPAQADALHYLENVAKKLGGKIIVGGHSKGGNLAIYSGAHASDKIKKRIITIFNFDGPGFPAEFFNSSEFLSIEKKLFTFVPQLSIIGMLFSHSKNYIAVESVQKGLQQHDPFSWQVSAHHFIERPDTDEQSKVISNAINGWFNDLDINQKKLFVETVFGILEDTNATTNTELTANLGNNILKMLKAMKQLDQTTRDAVFKTIQILFKCAHESVSEERKTKRITQNKK
jgi:hypothetical protein